MKQPLPLEQALAQAWPPRRWRDLTVLLAVSGGADSMALLRAAQQVRGSGQGRLEIAHFNHGLRGGQSDDDQAFVEQSCRELGLACHVGCGKSEDGIGDSASQEDSQSEANARDARYAFLERLAAKLGARTIATAHTADDQAETVLHRIVRGTGLSGLTGIPPVRRLSEAVTLVRPLLGVRRSRVIEYLSELGQPYREDSSNRDTRFTRNRIRHELLPALARDYNPAVVEALLRLADQAKDARAVIDALVESLLEKALRIESSEVALLDVRALRGQPSYLLCEALLEVWRRQSWPRQAMSHAKWSELAALLESESQQPGEERAAMFPGGVTARQRDGLLTLSRST